MLFFLVQPEFISTPQNLTVREGQDANLQCKVSGNPVPDVTWKKDGEAVNTGDQRILNVSITGNTVTSSLRIVSAVQAEQGPYRCVANNSLNTTNSYPGTLTIHCEYLIELFSLSLKCLNNPKKCFSLSAIPVWN